MSDLIDRDALKKAIGKVYGCDWDDIEKNFHFAEAVNSLPSAEPERKWIPCNARMPKEEKRCYWICTDAGYQCQCRWTNDVYGLGASDRWGWKMFDIPQYQKVVAWMPLPERWGGDNE